MKKLSLLVVLFFSATLIFACSDDEKSDDKGASISSLSFTDPVFQECVQSHNAGYVTQLTELDCSARAITSTAGIEQLTSLTSVNLNETPLCLDKTGLDALTGLTNFQMAQSPNILSPPDISFLSSLVNLTELNIEGNLLTDISVISGLTSIESLNISNNELTDISAISGMTAMKTLILAFNPNLSNIAIISSMTDLEMLEIRNCIIEDISSLANHTSLTELWMNGNRISDISSLASCTGLINIYANNQGTEGQGQLLTDITAFGSLTSLETLSLQENNSLVDISPLSTCSSLTELRLYGAGVTDVTALAGLTSLVTLDLRICPIIAGISSLSALTNLNVLNFASWGGSATIQCDYLEALSTALGTNSNGDLIVQYDSSSACIDSGTFSTDSNSPTAINLDETVNLSIADGETGYLEITTDSANGYGIYLNNADDSLSLDVGSVSTTWDTFGVGTVTVGNDLTQGFNVDASGDYLIQIDNSSGAKVYFDLFAREVNVIGGVDSSSARNLVPNGGTYEFGAINLKNYFSFTAAGTTATLQFEDLTAGVDVVVYDIDGTSSLMTSDGTEAQLTKTVDITELTNGSTYFLKIVTNHFGSSGMSVGQLTITSPTP